MGGRNVRVWYFGGGGFVCLKHFPKISKREISIDGKIHHSWSIKHLTIFPQRDSTTENIRIMLKIQKSFDFNGGKVPALMLQEVLFALHTYV